VSKIVMPKNSAILDEIKAAMKVYYDENDWLSNEVYTPRLMQLIGAGQDRSAYTKKAQIPAYFGFIEWEDITNNRSFRRLTALGKRFYEHWCSDNKDGMFEDLLYALENTIFGRYNYGCPDSDSDIEPPALIIRGIIDLGYMTKKEMVALLWYLEDSKKNYTETIEAIKNARIEEISLIETAPTYYSDNKPITMLVRWGFLTELDSVSGGYTISSSVKEKYLNRLRALKIYNIDKVKIEESQEHSSIISNHVIGNKVGENVILYGVPGCGKSHTIKTEYCNDKRFMERVVFHPDYTYSDFIGQILPVINKINGEENITYKFTAGPFTKILKDAIDDNEGRMHYLVIEEINRGNAPAIFGEVFQLLDRENGESEYGITNFDIADYVYGDKTQEVIIPKNLTILATMNTADQNVFTLDTAFKRRWVMRSIKNDVAACDHANECIAGTNVTWYSFAKKINDTIIDVSDGNLSSEDNRLGAYFVKSEDLKSRKVFGEKVLMYLWNDAFKYDRDTVFNSEYKTLEDLLSAFETKGFSVFNSNLAFDEYVENSTEKVDEAEYLNNKNQVLVDLYMLIRGKVIEKVPNTYTYTTSSKQYIGMGSNDNPKNKSYAEIKFKTNSIVIEIEKPTNIELQNLGSEIPYNGHYDHYFKIEATVETDIDAVVSAIVDSYEQLKG